MLIIEKMTAVAGMDSRADASLIAAKPMKEKSMNEFHFCISTQSYNWCKENNVHKKRQ